MIGSNFFVQTIKPSDAIGSTSDISKSFLKRNAINYYRDKFSLRKTNLDEQDDSENYYSDWSSEFDDNLDKGRDQFENVLSTENDPWLISVELSDLEIDDR